MSFIFKIKKCPPSELESKQNYCNSDSYHLSLQCFQRFLNHLYTSGSSPSPHYNVIHQQYVNVQAMRQKTQPDSGALNSSLSPITFQPCTFREIAWDERGVF